MCLLWTQMFIWKINEQNKWINFLKLKPYKSHIQDTNFKNQICIRINTQTYHKHNESDKEVGQR